MAATTLFHSTQSTNPSDPPAFVLLNDGQDHLSDVTEAVALEILSNLDAVDLLSAGQTSRKWHNISENKSLWEILCARDFPQAAVINEHYKQAYIEAYLSLNKMLAELPCPEDLKKELQKKLKEKGKAEREQIFNEFALKLEATLSPSELENIYITAGKFGCIPLMKSLKELPSMKLKYPPLHRYSNPKFIQKAAKEAILGGHFSAVQEIYPLSDLEKIWELFFICKSCNQIKIITQLLKEVVDISVFKKLMMAALDVNFAMELFVNHELFNQIEPNGEHNLGFLFWTAVTHGTASSETILSLMNHPKFNEIDPNDKAVHCGVVNDCGLASAAAAVCTYHGYHLEKFKEIALKLLKHPRFCEFPNLGKIFVSATRLNDYEILMHFLKNKNLYERISDRLFLSSILHLIRKHPFTYLSMLTTHPKVIGIGRAELISALCAALKGNIKDAIPFLMNLPNFPKLNEIEPNILLELLSLAKKIGDPDLIEAIKKAMDSEKVQTK